MSSYGVSAMRVWSSGSTFRWLALEGGGRASFKLVSLCGTLEFVAQVCGACRNLAVGFSCVAKKGVSDMQCMLHRCVQ
jgi:hypothetical protein